MLVLWGGISPKKTMAHIVCVSLLIINLNAVWPREEDDEP